VDAAPAAREPEGNDHRARRGGCGGGRVLLLRWMGLQPKRERAPRAWGEEGAGVRLLGRCK
jgi:hypothetical protein